MDELRGKLVSLDPGANINEVALIRTAIYLGNHLLSDRALPFPRVYRFYCGYIRSQLIIEDPIFLPKYRVFVSISKEFGDLL